MTETTHARTTWLFLRLLGLVYLAAFASIGTQVLGLAGHDGILPGPLDDRMLRAFSLTGVAAAALLTIGIAPAAMLVLLWLAYLVLSIACGVFLAYQWDTLLLEAGFLAIFVAPWVWRERLASLESPPSVAVWLFRWLVFRLMFGSGALKLLSGDPTWRDLTALAYHFETQPIPTPLAWYAHGLPPGALEALTAGMFGIELAVPLLIFAPRRIRATAFVPLAALQAGIAITGNYAFFNLLSGALCVFLLDDGILSRLGTVRAAGPARARVRNAVAIGAAIVTLPVSIAVFGSSLRVPVPGITFIRPLAALVLPWRIVNRYGLFAVMTTTRPEIVVEGSDDGETWREYEFSFKAGDVHRRPPWVAPHQPRLDWQMWFAALGDFESEPWFQAFCGRLLEADPRVLRLLAHDPFGGRRPRFVRAVLYRYRFSDRLARERTGAWWTREQLGDYSPVLSASTLQPPP